MYFFLYENLTGWYSYVLLKPFEITFLLFLSLKVFLSWFMGLYKQKLKHCLVFPCPSYLFFIPSSFQLSPALPPSLPSLPWRAGKAGAGALCCLSDCCGVVFVWGRSRDKKTTRQGWVGVFSPFPFRPFGNGWEESCLHDRISGGHCFLFRFLPLLLQWALEGYNKSRAYIMRFMGLKQSCQCRSDWAWLAAVLLQPGNCQQLLWLGCLCHVQFWLWWVRWILWAEIFRGINALEVFCLWNEGWNAGGHLHRLPTVAVLPWGFLRLPASDFYLQHLPLSLLSGHFWEHSCV